MKNIPIALFFAVLAISIYACQKDTTIPSVQSEEVVLYETTFTASDRLANTAAISWSTTGGPADVRFEIDDVTAGTLIYSYGWIGGYTSGSNTGNYSVTTGNTVRLRVKGRRPAGTTATPTLSYSFSSTCAIGGCGCGSFPVNQNNSIPWASILGANFLTGACL